MRGPNEKDWVVVEREEGAWDGAPCAKLEYRIDRVDENRNLNNLQRKSKFMLIPLALDIDRYAVWRHTYLSLHFSVHFEPTPSRLTE